MRRKSALSQKSHLQKEYRKCAIQGGSHLQYKKNFVQCERRMYSIRMTTSAAGGEGVWFEYKVCSITNFTSAVQVERVCSTRRVGSAV